jgi:WD40 repeat protein
MSICERIGGKVWDADKGQETLVLKGRTSGVSSVAFSPEGTRILTAGSRDYQTTTSSSSASSTR